MKNSKISKENLEWYLSQPTEVQLGMFENFVEMAKIHYNHLVEKETLEKAFSITTFNNYVSFIITYIFNF
ncbi:MAG: hypothetical protein FJW56_00730 [Actinobacteria bacterium]|nr:hypothetical protein [Actinomycetota bacterium]